MKKTGILNSQLSGMIAALGHKDLVMIGDAGMPIPKGVPIVDLAVTRGFPPLPRCLKRSWKKCALSITLSPRKPGGLIPLSGPCCKIPFRDFPMTPCPTRN